MRRTPAIERLLTWIGAVLAVAVLGLLALGWWLAASLAADTSDGEPCGGVTAAHVQFVVAAVGVLALVWTAVTVIRLARGEARKRTLLWTGLPAVGLFVAWWILASSGCPTE